MPKTQSTSRPSTPTTAGTVIHRPNTPQAPKKPKTKRLEYLKPAVYNPEANPAPKVSQAILSSLSRAGVRKSPPPPSTHPKAAYPLPRKLTLSVVDGSTGDMIHKYVPTRLLTRVSTTAANVLDAKPWAGTFKVYGKYSRASLSAVLNAIILSQNMPVATNLSANLSTYEACLRLGIFRAHAAVKPLVAAVNAQIAAEAVDAEVMAFVTYRLGAQDPVFEHMAHVLCYQRFKGMVGDVVGFERMVGRRPAMQRAMGQIDRTHKARREAVNAVRRGGDGVTGVEEHGASAIALGKGGVGGKGTEEQKEVLLGLLRGTSVLKTGEGEKMGKAE